MDQNSELYKDLDRVLLTREEIAVKVRELGEKITRDYAGRKPVLVCILKGAAVFFTDLIREIDLPLTLDFMAISSYGSATKTSGVVRILKDLDNDILGKDVIVVEDIVDSGITDYRCFDIPDAFVVGYGLDYDQTYRNLPDIGVLSPRIYEKE